MSLGALAALALFALFFVQGQRVRFWDPDEPLYAQSAREMWRRGDFVSIVFNGRALWDKPAMNYWLVLAAERILGETERATRLPAALAALVVCFLVFRWSRRDASESPAGWATVLILSTSVEFFAFARIGTPDMPLCAFLLGSLFSLYLYLDAGHRPAHLIAAWALGALGMLTKGPVGIVLPLLCASAFLVLSRRPREILTLIRPLPVAVFLAVSVPWYLAMSLRNPGYFRVFFLEHNLERFVNDRYHHFQPVWFFLPIFAAGVFPWIFHFLSELRAAWREPHRRFALVSILTIIAFFSPSASKLPGYILPTFALAAVVAAPAVLRGGRVLTALLALQLAAAFLLLNLPLLRDRWPRFLSVQPPPATFLVAAGAGVVMLVLLAGWRDWAAGLAGLATVSLVWSAMLGLDRYKPAEQIARDVASRGDLPFADFWLQRRQYIFLASVVFYRDDSVIELRRAEELHEFFRRPDRVLCLIYDGDFRQIPWPGNVPLYRIADYQDINYRAVLISNRPDP